MSKLARFREALEQNPAIILNEERLEAVKPLLESGKARLVSVKSVNGERCFRDCGEIHSTIVAEIKSAMVEEFCAFLNSQDNIQMFDSDMIAARDKALSENPPLEGESPEEHFLRVAEESTDGWLVPACVKEPGYYGEDDNCYLSSSEMEAGFFFYDFDNWRQYVVLAKPWSGSWVQLYEEAE